MDSTTKFFKRAIVKLFAAVGKRATFEEILAWAQQDSEWYTRHTWTVAKREAYRKWFLKNCPKDWRKHTAEREWGWFNLMYGWKEQE
jgi:hypothetical protein